MKTFSLCCIVALCVASLSARSAAQTTPKITGVSAHWLHQAVDERTVDVQFSELATIASARIFYGDAIDRLDRRSASVDLSPGGKRFSVAIKYLAPGHRTYFRAQIHLPDGTTVKSDVTSTEIPKFTDRMPVLDVSGDNWNRNPCHYLLKAGRASDTRVWRVSEHGAVACQPATFQGSIFQGSGQHGQLDCPPEFARNLNWSRVEFTIPKIGLPLIFGDGTSYARQTEHLRFNLWKPSGNVGFEGSDSPLRQGYQKWDATNWTPTVKQAWMWIWCTDDFATPPGKPITID